MPHAVRNRVLTDTYGKTRYSTRTGLRTGPRAGTPDLNRPAVFKTCQTKIFGIAAPTRNPRSPEGKPKKQADQPGPRCVKPNTWFEYVSHASAQRRTTVTTNSSSQCQTAVHKSTKRISLECANPPTLKLRRTRLRPRSGFGRHATRSPQGEGWWSRTGSNRRPEACKATALPTELRPRC